MPAARLPRPSRLPAPLPAALVTLVLLAACAGQTPSLPRSSHSGTAGQVPGRSLSAQPEPTAAGTSATPRPRDPDRLRLELVADGLSDPIGITAAGDGSGRLFVNERAGAIRIIGPGGSLRGEPFVDLSSRILAGGERGLLGLAFHPDFEANRRLFVHYSRAGDGATVISELRASADLSSADPGSERILLTVDQPFANHNGGQIEFGPDGYLYIGLGDGGSAGDPFGNAQNPDVLLGKLLRLDVDSPPQAGRAYALPPDNPFGPEGARPGAGLPEIWAVGLRNPWRFGFDPDGGDLYIGDVGQGQWEEIDRQPADSPGGENYGWNLMEGAHCFIGECNPDRFVAPLAEYSHEFGCSVTGGYVYRGPSQAALQGIYVFADYCSGIIFTVPAGEATASPKQVLASDLGVSAFGTDEDGELYLADIGGGIYRVLVDG